MPGTPVSRKDSLLQQIQQTAETITTLSKLAQQPSSIAQHLQCHAMIKQAVWELNTLLEIPHERVRTRGFQGLFEDPAKETSQ